MDFVQLESALAIAKCRSFTKASQMIHISQPALSQQMQRLESELGVRLFERTSRAIVLTEAGMEFIKHAENIINEKMIIEQTVYEHKTAIRGHLRVGTMFLLGQYGFAQFTGEFRKEYPQVLLEVSDMMNCSQIVEALENREIDIGILNDADEYPTIDVAAKIIEDRLCCVLNRAHPQSGAASIRWEDLANESLLLPKSNERLYEKIVQKCREAGFEPNITCRSSNIYTILDFISSNCGIALLSEVIADFVSGGAGQSMARSVPLCPPVPREICLAVCGKYSLSPVSQVFIDFTTHWYGMHPSAGTVDEAPME